MYLADQLIITLGPKVPNERAHRLLTQLGMRIDAQLSESVFTVRLTETDLDAAPEALRSLAAHPEIVATAEIDGVGFAGATPNDPAFPAQWGLLNTGEFSGSAGADVNAPPFWDLVETAGRTVLRFSIPPEFQPPRSAEYCLE
jgi:hypothetical protein